MNLHRTSAKADWEKVAPAKHNLFQKVAAATGGFVSPANVVTIIGLGIVVYGLIAILNEQYWLGLVLLAVGRLLDIVDGVVAEATKTKSPLGEIFDAAADKVGTILTLLILIIGGITNIWILAALIAPQVITPFVALYKKRTNQTIHPTRQGKLSMATAWVGIVGLLVVKALNDFQPLAVAVSIIIVISFALGMYALWQYVTGRDQD